MTEQAVAASAQVEHARAHRVRVHEVLLALSGLPGSPAPGAAEQWWSLLRTELDRLAGAFAEHVALTEAPDGLHAEMIAVAPRLTAAVRRLRAEHRDIAGLISALCQRAIRREDPEALRAGVTSLLARVHRHRRRGADLVHQAYAVDIGGD